MAETRVCVAIHFTFDPAKQLAEIPKELTKTIAVGDTIIPTKVGPEFIGGETKTAILLEMEKLVLKAQKTAKPAKKEAPKAKPAEEEGAQGSLL